MKKEEIEKMGNQELKTEWNDITFHIRNFSFGRWELRYQQLLEDELEKRREEESEDEDEEKKEDALEDKDEDKKDEEAEDEDEEKKDDERDAVIKAIRAELTKLKAKFNKAELKPIVDRIVTAKIRLNEIKESESDKEAKSLYELPIRQLNQLSKTYKQFGRERPYSVLQYGEASIRKESGDSFLIELGGRN